MQPIWDWLVAIYLFLGGLGAGAFLVAATLELSGKRYKFDFCPASLVGATLSGPLVGVGALLLILDLGAGMREPLRIFHMFANPTSVMTWGIWILCLFIPVALAYGSLEIVDAFAKGDVAKLSPLRTARRILAAAGSILAVGTAIYTGVLVSAVGPSMPFWSVSLPLSIPVMPLLFLVSAISTGVGLTLLVSGTLMLGDVGKQIRRLPLIHLVLILLEVTLVVLLLVLALRHGGVAAEAVWALATGHNSVIFWALFVVPGLVLPLAVLVLGVVGVHRWSLEVIAGIGIIFAGLILRYLVLISGIPATL
jgi:formate-dependent nitrite reductase membrane component NrfD